MEKALRRIGELLDQRPMFDWNRFRWADGVLSIHWLYDRTGQSWLLDLTASALARSPKGDTAKPGRTTVGLSIPPAAAGVIAIVVAQPRMPLEGAQDSYARLTLVLTVLLSLMMVSTLPFRSFKDLRLNTSTVLLVSFAVGSSAFIWRHYSVHLVLVWLLSIYVAIGMLEAIRVLARRSRKSLVRQSVPPAEP